MRIVADGADGECTVVAGAEVFRWFFEKKIRHTFPNDLVRLPLLCLQCAPDADGDLPRRQRSFDGTAEIESPSGGRRTRAPGGAKATHFVADFTGQIACLTCE